MKKISIEYFNGWPVKRMMLPGGDQIILTFCRDGSEPKRSLYDGNHNIYRLNPAGGVVWQVKRDDSIMGPGWWERLEKHAKERGEAGAWEPFIYIWLEYTDGRPACYSDERGDGKLILTWEPECSIIRLRSSYGCGLHYILDPDTGIAKQIEIPFEGRPW